MTGLVIIADEVRAAATANVADRLEGELAGEFTCVVCSLDGSTFAGDNVSAIAFEHDNGVVFRLAHTTCSPSKLIHTGSELTPPTGDGELDVASRCTVLPNSSGKLRAVLIIEQIGGPRAIAEDGAEINPWLDGLKARGWKAITSLEDQLARDWGASLRTDRTTGAGSVTVDNAILLDRLPEGDGITDWIDVARRAGSVSIYVGQQLNLRHSEATESASLREAMEDGRVIGTRIGLVNKDSRPVPRTEESRAAARVAKDLRDALNQRARPGSTTGKFNTTPNVVPFSNPLQVSPAMFGENTPILLVDFDPNGDAADVPGTIAALQNAGLPLWTAWDKEVFHDAPAQWGALTWPSQVMILAGEGKKLLFEPFQAAPDWFAVTKQRSGFGLLVGAFNLAGKDGEDVKHAVDAAMTRDTVVACQMFSMPAS